MVLEAVGWVRLPQAQKDKLPTVCSLTYADLSFSGLSSVLKLGWMPLESKKKEGSHKRGKRWSDPEIHDMKAEREQWGYISLNGAGLKGTEKAEVGESVNTNQDFYEITYRNLLLGKFTKRFIFCFFFFCIKWFEWRSTIYIDNIAPRKAQVFKWKPHCQVNLRGSTKQYCLAFSFPSELDAQVTTHFESKTQRNQAGTELKPPSSQVPCRLVSIEAESASKVLGQENSSVVLPTCGHECHSSVPPGRICLLVHSGKTRLWIIGSFILRSETQSMGGNTYLVRFPLSKCCPWLG